MGVVKQVDQQVHALQDYVEDNDKKDALKQEGLKSNVLNDYRSDKKCDKNRKVKCPSLDSCLDLATAQCATKPY